MDIAIWIVSGALALLYLTAGFTKTFGPIDKLRLRMPYVETIGAKGIRFVGIVEMLGAIGLILPRLVDIAPWLAIAAAFGLALVQVVAIPLHAVRKEWKAIPVNVVLIAAPLFVAIGLLATQP